MKNIRIKIKNLIAYFLYYSGLLTLYDYLFLGSYVVILMYHKVLQDDEPLQREIEPGMYVKKSSFEKQMKFIQNKFTVAELTSCFLNSKNSFKDKFCVVTFDDGWQDNFEVAYPILKKYNIPATIFLVPKFIESNELTSIDTVITISYRMRRQKKDILNKKSLNSKPYLSWDELQLMKENGIHFGAHGLTHAILTKISQHEVEQEIDHSKKILERKLNCQINTFCYPNGEYNRSIIKILKENNYILAVTTVEGRNKDCKFLYRLKRVAIHDDISYSIPLFYSKLLGVL